MLPNLQVDCQHSKLGWVEQIQRRVGMSISQLLLGPHAPNILEAPKTHRNICRLLGRCWHTCRLSTSNKNQSQVEQRHGRVGQSVFQLLLGPHAPNVLWRFLRHIGRFLDHLGGVDTPIGIALAPTIQAKLNKYMESVELNILASIKASFTKFGFGGFWDTWEHF